jgi:predicted metalloprotease with PDZ domain
MTPAKNQEEIVSKIKLICETAYEIFGEYPFGSYYFFLDFGFTPGEWDAMEHANSMRMTDTVDCDTQEKVSDLLRLAAHELFHAWNIKGMVPRELVSCDLTREVYCPSLWIAEGLASYYQYVILLRAGIISRDDFMRFFCEIISQYELGSGKEHMSLKEASRGSNGRGRRIRTVIIRQSRITGRAPLSDSFST